MSFAYSEMDRLILQRWPEVVGLIEAHRDVQERVEEMIEVVGERLARWARPLGFEMETLPKRAEFQAWRPTWADKRRGRKVELVLGHFCPVGFRKVESSHPFLWVYTMGLENFKMKVPERVAFAESLRTALGEEVKAWSADDVVDADSPLGRYITAVDDAERAALISSPDALYEFAVRHFPVLFGLADVIDVELAKLQK